MAAKKANSKQSGKASSKSNAMKVTRKIKRAMKKKGVPSNKNATPSAHHECVRRKTKQIDWNTIMLQPWPLDLIMAAPDTRRNSNS